MKKIISITLCMLLMVGALSGCGSSDNGSTQEDVQENVQDDGKESVDTGKATSVELGKEYTTSDNVGFSLFKIVTSGKLQAISGSGSYYEADSGCNYIDVIVSLTNNGSRDMTVRDSLSAFFESGDGTRYEDSLIAVESRDDYLDQFGSIKPLASNKVHIGYKVPNNIDKGKAYFDFGSELFVVDYDASVDVSNKTSVSFNQEIKADDVASFELLKTNFTADVLPPKTSGYYTHYQVDDPSNDTFFVVYCNLTNHSASAIRSDEMISIKAIFDGKYEYNANMALEEKDGTGFDYANITSIEPLETRKSVFMFEIPKKVKDMNYELSIYFYGNEYTCSK